MGRLPESTAAVATGKAGGTRTAKSKKAGRPKGSKSAIAPVAKRGRKSKAEIEALAAAEKAEIAKLADTLTYKVPSAWDAKDFNRKVVFSFAEQYKTFLDKAKTEREFVREAVLLCESKGFRNIDTLTEDHPLVPGDKVYRVVKNKLIMMAVIGTNPMTDGTRMLGAHVDSPRIDIKQNPLYEANDMGFLKTHYYGGIKKYQWAAIPLAIHGVFVKTDGTTVDIVIGEDEKDPIFTITDLLPHLAKDQYEKKLADAFAGESMNILLGSEPFASEDAKEKVKFNLLRLLNESHGIKEEDFLSAEIEIVPAFKARDLGLDRSMIGAYGHDDRVCAYPAMMAVLESEDPETTSLCILTDKEEIGSVGNTGAQSRAMENFLADLCAMSSTAIYTDRALRRCLDRSKMLSADVTAAVDPNYEGTHDKLNASYLGKGLAIMKYSGARGKSGASDAHAEYVAEVRRILNEAGVSWQTTELGAVDKGGGGTIAMMIANLGVDVIDCGVPVLSMHAPFEVASKVDLYNTYKAYKAFLK
jgi:aspartyl aminopeptidase